MSGLSQPSRRLHPSPVAGESVASRRAPMSAIGQRLRAAAIHLAISAALAGLAALVVFVFWYPYPYRVLSGGRELFTLLISVDVIIGPLITLAVFNVTKPREELRRDLAIVGLLQLAALTY